MTTAPDRRTFDASAGTGLLTRRGGTVTVYRDRLRRNAVAMRLAYGPRTIAVIKGDGYGLGVVTCATELAAAGFRVMGVGSHAEARQVRAAGVTARLIIVDAADVPYVESGSDVEWLVGQVEVEQLLRRRAGATIRIHVDIDFGVGRGGVPRHEADRLLSALLAHPATDVVGFAGHLPSNPTDAAAREAHVTLERLRRRCPSAIVHLGGSDVLRSYRPTPAVGVRLGRPLYGIKPRGVDGPPMDRLAQAWAWRANATTYPAPPSVGYRGSGSPSGTPVRIDVGYADGLPVHAAGRWPVLVNGHRYTIHEVFMLSAIAYPVAGELPAGTSAIALLSGQDDQHCLPIRQISEPMSTASTGILLHPRSPRIVTDEPGQSIRTGATDTS